MLQLARVFAITARPLHHIQLGVLVGKATHLYYRWFRGPVRFYSYIQYKHAGPGGAPRSWRSSPCRPTPSKCPGAHKAELCLGLPTIVLHVRYGSTIGTDATTVHCEYQAYMFNPTN